MNQKKKLKKIINAATIISSLLCMITIVPGIVLWNQLPDLIAIHFGINGQPDGFMTKGPAIIGSPVLFVVINLVMNISPKYDAEKLPKALQYIFTWFVPVITFVVMTSIYIYNLGIQCDIILIAEILVAFVFIIIGNYLPKTPAEMVNVPGISSENATEDDLNHKKKVARKLGIGMVIIGFIMLLTCFTPFKTIFFITSLILLVILSAVLIFKK